MRQAARLARRLARLLGLLGVALVIYLVALEVALQAVAVVAHREIGRELASSWVGGSLRVLCLGDSNTFGLYLRSKRRTHSYPAQLEGQWNDSGGRPPIEVLNFGIPGMNSSAVRRDLPALLERLTPELVILMIGANDFWTETAEADSARNAGSGVLRSWLRRSRVHRLYLLLRSRLDPENPDALLARVSRTPRRAEGDEEEAARTTSRTLPENLREIARLCARAGTRLLLMTYPSDYKLYGSANRLIRRAAAASGVPLIDLTGVFRPLCRTSACPELLFRDRHPNARGYALIAEAIAAQLKQRGLVAARGG